MCLSDEAGAQLRLNLQATAARAARRVSAISRARARASSALALISAGQPLRVLDVTPQTLLQSCNALLANQTPQFQRAESAARAEFPNRANFSLARPRPNAGNWDWWTSRAPNAAGRAHNKSSNQTLRPAICAGSAPANRRHQRRCHSARHSGRIIAEPAIAASTCSQRLFARAISEIFATGSNAVVVVVPAWPPLRRVLVPAAISALNHCGKRVGAHREFRVMRNEPHIFPAEAREQRRFFHGTVAVRGNINRQRLFFTPASRRA